MAHNTPKKNDAGILNRILPSLRQALFANLLFSFFINLLMLTPSIFMLQVYDRVVPSRNMMTLLMLTLLTLALYAMSSGLEWVRSRLLVRLGNQLEGQLGKETFAAAIQSHLAGRGGDARQAVGDLATLRQFLTGGRLQPFLDAPWTPIYIVFCFILHPYIGWFAICSSICLISLATLTERLTHPRLTEANAAFQGASRFAGSQMPHVEAIHAMGMLPALSERWSIRQNRALSLQQEANDIAGITSAATRFFRTSVQSLGLALGAYLVVDQGLSGGAMVIISILVGRALAPMEGILGGLQALEGARSAHQRLNDLLCHPDKRESTVSLPRPQGNLTVDALFAAPPGAREALLKGINFSLPAGSVLVVVGPSGSGKSTLARLLTGVWPATRGHVRLDGADVYQWDKAELGPWLGYLPQDVEVLEGTIADNISRFGERDSDKIIAAAKSAGIHDMILKLPNGYDTLLGPGGIRLSGGQQQRLGLARAIYGTPSFIVLDEPNSNLDEAGERALMQSILHLKSQGVTTVIISHRTPVVSIADKLLVMRDGMAVGFGTPAEIQKQLGEKSAAQPPRREITPGSKP